MRWLLVAVCVFYSSMTLAAAERIIAMAPHVVEMLYAIGAGDNIVGTTEYADYPEAAKSIPRIGNYNGLQIEKILMLKPDLVVVWKGGNPGKDIEKLESLGLTIYDSSPKTMSHIFSDLRYLGELTGHTSQAKQVIKRLEGRYQQLIDTYQNKPPVAIFYQLWHNPLRTVANGSAIQQMLEGCGAKNIFAELEGFPLVSMESVLQRQPEAIIIPNHSANQAPDTEHWLAWPGIPAVKNQQFISIDGDLLHRTSPRILEGMSVLCDHIDALR